MRRAFVTLVLVAPALLAGCGEGVDATYGRVHSPSLNGTGALAEMFRARGDKVRVALRLTDEVGEKADTIVRFAPYPGPPDSEEADWYDEWLFGDESRRLIYVPFDYNAESEYWTAMLARLPADAADTTKRRAERRRNDTKTWATNRPKPSKAPAQADVWYGVNPPSKPPRVAAKLEGPWADDLDPKAVALTLHDTLKPGSDADVLLAADGEPLVFEEGGESEPQILVLANGSFLLNFPLVNKARRPLARRVVDWAGSGPRRIVFVESQSPTNLAQQKPPSPAALLWIEPFGLIFAHVGVLALVASLAVASQLGRPRPEPPSGSDRPAAHAEALGDLLAKARDAASARATLEAYRRWRHPASGAPSPRRGRIV